MGILPRFYGTIGLKFKDFKSPLNPYIYFTLDEVLFLSSPLVDYPFGLLLAWPPFKGVTALESSCLRKEVLTKVVL